MKYGDMTLGKIEALINIIGGKKVVDSLLNGTSKFTVEATGHLGSLKKYMVSGYKCCPLNFFINGEGLTVSDDFQEFILATAKEGAVRTKNANVHYADLIENARDVVIRGELPEEHVFDDVDNFLGLLSRMVYDQWGGKEGVLVKKDFYANMFYVKGIQGDVYNVLVSWISDTKKWECEVIFNVDYTWLPRFRIFSAKP